MTATTSEALRLAKKLSSEEQAEWIDAIRYNETRKNHTALFVIYTQLRSLVRSGK